MCLLHWGFRLWKYQKNGRHSEKKGYSDSMLWWASMYAPSETFWGYKKWWFQMLGETNSTTFKEKEDSEKWISTPIPGSLGLTCVLARHEKWSYQSSSISCHRSIIGTQPKPTRSQIDRLNHIGGPQGDATWYPQGHTSLGTGWCPVVIGKRSYFRRTDAPEFVPL